MRDAAVGFQCPSCIAEGRKSTRSGRTAYGGLRPGNAGITSMVLIGINVVVWLAITVTGGAGSRLVDLLSLRAQGLCAIGQRGYDTTQAACAVNQGSQWLPGVNDGAWWQLATNMFAHVEILHIAFNMLALWVLGPQLELAVGRARFLALYLLSGLAGSVFVYWLTPQFTSTLGASGAVFGLMGALLVLALKVGGQVQQLLLWIGINAAFTLVGANISWQGHLGGFLGGGLIATILAFAPRQRRTLWQSVGLSAVFVVLVVAVLARTAALA